MFCKNQTLTLVPMCHMCPMLQTTFIRFQHNILIEVESVLMLRLSPPTPTDYSRFKYIMLFFKIFFKYSFHHVHYCSPTVQYESLSSLHFDIVHHSWCLIKRFPSSCRYEMALKWTNRFLACKEDFITN